MYCKKCGFELEESTSFCTDCGQKAYVDDFYIEPGFSEMSEDPTIQLLRKRARTYKIKGGVILGVIVFLGVQLLFIGEDEAFTLRYISAGILTGMIPVLLGLVASWKDITDRTFTGTIIRVKCKKDWKDNDDETGGLHNYYDLVHVLKVKKDGYGRRTFKYKKNGIAGYYHLGDKVKYHANFQYLEKFDKNTVDKLFCINCFRENKKTDDYCIECHAALMK